MATKTSKSSRLLQKHKHSLAKDVDINQIVTKLTQRGALNKKEEEVIFECADQKKKADIFVDILNEKGSRSFNEFCAVLEDFCPHLLTKFLLDSGADSDSEKKPTQALQLGFELALKERDAVLRENARAIEDRDRAVQRAKQLLSERDRALASLENLAAKQNTPQIERRASSPIRRNKEKIKAVDSDLETEVEESSDNVVWETHKVGLTRVPGFGFGIAVSGGRDNPHFANGDPSIAISDVLKAGPAEGRLQINDRVLSVNGVALENVDHATAIGVLKESGGTVNLVIKRRIVLPASLENETPPLKITLAKRNRKDEYGLVLGCKYYIKEIVPNSLAAQEGGLKEGDTVLKLNNSPIESLSLVEARKLLEKSKEKLQLIITKKKNDEWRKDDGYSTMQSTLPKHSGDVNMYRPSNPEQDPYKAQFSPQDIPAGAYPPNSPHSRYDGRYIYDHEAVPPRPPLPTGLEDKSQPRSPSPMKDGYYSDREDLRRKQSYGNYATVNDEVDVGLGRRHHEERYVGKRKDIRPEPRLATFRKDKEVGLGLRLAGGNSTGIFVASVQPGSGAEREGLTDGDHIMKANDKDIVGLTREEAVTYLTSLEGMVTLYVQYKKEDFDRIMSSHEAGDSFYIRTHFNYEQLEPGELSFVQGDIFHIKDTLFRGVVGSWLAVRMGRNNQETQKGIIPNKNRAEQLAISNQGTSEEEKENSPSKGRGLLFKRKAARRSKSLSKDHWEDVIFAHLQTKFPAYERVVLKDCGFVRPVVIFGPLADVARERILKDMPDKFQSPQSEHHADDERKGRSGIIRLGSIRDVINRRKHCLLDVTPHNVDRLNFAAFSPIVVFLKSDCKTTVKEIRAKWAKGSSKNPKKMYEQSLKLEKYYQHLFTATVTHNSSETWYKKLVDMIELQQQQQIWMSEKKPDEDITDDYLFPMSSHRFSFSGSQGTTDSDITHALDDMDKNPVNRKRFLVRSSSDPSINTTDRVPGIPPYPDPPRYTRSHKMLYDGNQNYQDIAYDDSYTQRSEDRYYPSYYADDVDRRFNRANIDPYATITPSERLRGRIPSDSQWNNGYNDQPPASPNEVEYSRPLPRQQRHQSPSNQQGQNLDPPSPGYSQLPSQQNHPPLPPPHNMYSDNSSYSSDSFSKYTSNPANKHDDSKLREKMGQVGSKPKGNDPYRFTRSTANKVNTSNVDKGKLSDLSAKFRLDTDRSGQKLSNSSLNTTRTPQNTNSNAQNISKHQTNEPDLVIGSTAGQVQMTSPQGHLSPSRGHEGQSSRVMGRKQPPPVPVKTYKGRESEPDEQKLRNFENGNLSGYKYPAENPYGKTRGHPNDVNRYPVSPVDHYKAEDPYEWVAPRRQSAGNQRSVNRNSRGEFPESPGNVTNQNSRSFMNQIYMDTAELNKYRQEREQQQHQQQHQSINYGSPENRSSPKKYHQSRNYHALSSRTDDELQKLKQSDKTHSKSSDHVASVHQTPDILKGNQTVSKSTEVVDQNHSNNHKRQGSHLETQHKNPNFSSYKKLITAGSYQSSKVSSKSQDEIRDPRELDINHMRGGSGSSQAGSAFESYNKASPLSTFGKNDSGAPRSPGKPGVDIKAMSRLEDNRLSTVEERFEKVSNQDENEDHLIVNGQSEQQDESCDIPAHILDQSNGIPSQSCDTSNQSDVILISCDQDSQSECSISTPDTVIYGGGFDSNQDVDENHTVVATARGLFNNQGGVLESPETGVSIVIPSGALNGDQEQEIYFKVCRDNTILPPLDREKGETLLSPLVMCGPHGLKFNTPVELRLPHCASVNPDSWSFALKSSDSPAGQPTHWQNMTLAEREGHTQSRVGKNSVSVLVDHF
ncbi:tight junction protein ZO-1-like isoform X3 [Mya arenaria]|uniref:tight junction protein ZO-1-like isoform X3 n=1 Tax=Mya arenaria TaxID=6604 RepID=UPI0022DFE0DC|nr:tight junction protein ZO-1-like isoform X3 [Mya arenaria]